MAFRLPTSAGRPASTRRPIFQFGRRNTRAFSRPETAAAEAASRTRDARLKKIVADLSLDREMLQDVIRRKLLRPSLSQARAGDGGLPDEWGVSIRRACSVLEFDRFDPTITNPVVASRPALTRDQGDLPDARPLRVPAASMSSCVAKAGRST